MANSINALTVQVVMASSSRNPDRALQRSLQEAASDVQRTSDLMVRYFGDSVRMGHYSSQGTLPRLSGGCAMCSYLLVFERALLE